MDEQTLVEEPAEVTKVRRSPALTIVTDSEVATWNSCPQKHHFQYRDRLRPMVEGKALAIGSIFHRGMSAGLLAGWSTGWRSRPNSQRLVDQITAARQGIDELVLRWAGKVAKHDPGVDFDKLSTDVDQTSELVKWMLGYYFEQTQRDLENFVLVEVEKPFVCDLHDRRGRVMPHLKFSGVRDAVFFDPEYNQIVLAEHKTSGNDPQSIEKRVEMDTQTAGYLYALRQARGEGRLKTVEGTDLSRAYLGRVIYNVLKKSMPHPPKVNKDGSVSVAQCVTTVEYYAAAIVEQEQRGIPMSPKQRDFIELLAKHPSQFFARVEYHRTNAELERWRSDTLVNAARIRAAGNEPSLRSRNTGHCNQPWSLPCTYRAVCLDDSPEICAQYRIAPDAHAEVRAAESNTDEP